MRAAILELLRGYAARGTTAAEINQGDCLYFAGEVAKRVPGVECLWDTDLDQRDHRGHMVIRYRGRWYDAECPDGVADWKQLPSYAPERDEGYRLVAGQWMRPGS